MQFAFEQRAIIATSAATHLLVMPPRALVSAFAIAVSAFALWAGPALFAAGTFGAYATTAAIGIGGSLLINALVGPKPGATNAPNATQDQIYSASAQGNVARLGQPLPVWYGRLKRFPDFAATPWAEFVGNDQYLNILLSVSMGSVAYEALYLDDTILSAFGQSPDQWRRVIAAHAAQIVIAVALAH